MNDQTTTTIGDSDLESTELWDPAVLGGIIDGRRKGAGIRRREDLPAAILQATGYNVSENTIGAVERGERLPSIQTLVAIMLTLNITCQDLAPAVLEEQRDKYRRLSR